MNKLGLNPKKDFETIKNQGVFGWHGTRKEEAVKSIILENLDPLKRNG